MSISKGFISFRTRLNKIRLKKLPDAFTMPGLATLGIGAAKRMTAAIMFFDFEKFTNITSLISPEQTLMILNISTTTVMKIIREWGGTVEKHTGDGVMAIIGTETRQTDIIAQEAIDIGLHRMNFLTAVGKVLLIVLAKLQALAKPNGIAIGENLAKNLHPYLQDFLYTGNDPE